MATTRRKKLALCIGNNKYTNYPLLNCVNDARAVEETLTRMGFSVMSHTTNLNAPLMSLVLKEFSSKISPGDVVVFFFAGHGCEYKEENYLSPIDDGIKTKAQEVFKSISDKQPYFSVFLLDCCRTNPEIRGPESPSARGLAKMEAPAGSLLVFACQPGKWAYDRRPNSHDVNSIFTTALLEFLPRTELSMLNMMNRVVDQVHWKSNGDQKPYLDESKLRWRDTSLHEQKCT
jgi:uncharacterized caspase-like protein